MKKTLTFLSMAVILITATSAFIINNTGIAGQTGAPGETSCSYCHGGGSSAASGITITAVPSFSNNEYVPNTNYSITVTVQANGFSHYGFGCEILDDNNSNIGTIQTAGSGVKFLTAAGRKNAVHSTPKSGTTATFSFHWVAPDVGFGNANFYVAANAVNLNNNTSGDFPITPISMQVNEGAAVVIDGVEEHKNILSQLSVYPNPANGFANLSYSLNKAGAITVDLLSMDGKQVKQLISENQYPAEQSKFLNLQNVPSGVYFLRVSLNKEQTAQKLIVVK